MQNFNVAAYVIVVIVLTLIYVAGRITQESIR